MELIGSDLMRLLDRAYRGAGDVLAAIPADRLGAQSPCEEWTVREVADHLVGALDVFGRIAEGREPDLSVTEGDHLGDDPVAAFRAAAGRCTAAFARPGVLEREFPFVFGPTPGRAIAGISLSEALIHGWDLAQGAGLPYEPDDDVVAAVLDFQSQGDEEIRRRIFGPARPTPPDAPPFTRLLGLTGRRA